MIANSWQVRFVLKLAKVTLNLIFIADVCLHAVISSMGQISPLEWTTGVCECDELASLLIGVYDDIRRKFTSNVKNEFVVS